MLFETRAGRNMRSDGTQLAISEQYAVRSIGARAPFARPEERDKTLSFRMPARKYVSGNWTGPGAGLYDSKSMQ